ncbi:MAG TPA: response regulator transcription factor [Terriglobales bacterium]|nr:response regulator transcription factor [Terriglobales bacterium]
MAIRCIIVDDHALFREGLRHVLESEPDFEVVGEAGDAVQGQELVRELKPDVVLMDIAMPGTASFEAARLMAKDAPDTRLILLTIDQDEDYLLQFLKVGATGYIPKDTAAPNLLSAVREVYQGRKYLSPQMLGKLVDDFRSRGKVRGGQSRGVTLTPREREVVKMIAEGYSVKEIAVRLGRSVKTVEAHKFNLMRKLDIHNKAQLVTYAIQKKIVKMPAGA